MGLRFRDRDSRIQKERSQESAIAAGLYLNCSEYQTQAYDCPVIQALDLALDAPTTGTLDTDFHALKTILLETAGQPPERLAQVSLARTIRKHLCFSFRGSQFTNRKIASLCSSYYFVPFMVCQLRFDFVQAFLDILKCSGDAVEAIWGLLKLEQHHTVAASLLVEAFCLHLDNVVEGNTAHSVAIWSSFAGRQHLVWKVLTWQIRSESPGQRSRQHLLLVSSKMTHIIAGAPKYGLYAGVLVKAAEKAVAEDVSLEGQLPEAVIEWNEVNDILQTRADWWTDLHFPMPFTESDE